MKFLIVSHVIHKHSGNKYYGYRPYVKEMNLWTKYVDEVMVMAPMIQATPTSIDIAYDHDRLKFIPVRSLNFTGVTNSFKSLVHLPWICMKMFLAMREADHIHLRCPGNMGLIGCLVQLLFPSKVKTAKYAGNWDFKSRQPFTYRLQQRLLRNTFFTKNMTALVYGQWPDTTRNIRPFFTASYDRSEQHLFPERRSDDVIQLIFVGTLTSSKQPLLSTKVCHALRKQGYHAVLHIYGEGAERAAVEQYIQREQLQSYVVLHGNQPAAIIKEAFQQSHFLVFISRSEGWPKAVAEAMWWGCLPVTTQVSCIPEMVGFGERGELVGESEEQICQAIISNIKHPVLYQQKCRRAMQWARNYTIEFFESEIKKMIV